MSPTNDRWDFADEAVTLACELRSLRWWRWRRRRVLLERAKDLVAEAAEIGLDLAPLFGMEPRRLGLA